MNYQTASRALSLAILTVALFLTGCASSVSRPNTPANAPHPVALTAAHPASSITIELSDKAKAADSDNKFNAQDLKARISNALERNGLLVQDKAQQATVTIRITDLRIRGTFTAIFWGVMAGPDMVTADVTVTGSDGKELDSFSISANYGLGGFGGGQDNNRLGWMYDKLTEHLLEQFKVPEKTAEK